MCIKNVVFYCQKNKTKIFMTHPALSSFLSNQIFFKMNSFSDAPPLNTNSWVLLNQVHD